jgi:hypothetical protein
MVPGWDRPFVTLSLPSNPQEFVEKGGKLFMVEVDMPGFEKVDGTIRTTAKPVDYPGIRLPDPTKPV